MVGGLKAEPSESTTLNYSEQMIVPHRQIEQAMIGLPILWISNRFEQENTPQCDLCAIIIQVYG